MCNEKLRKEAETTGFLYKKMGRRLVWHDEFNKPNIDTEKWNFTRAMWSTDVEYDNSENCARIEEGKLHLQVKKSVKPDMTVILPDSFSTIDTMNYKYGYLEMRCKIPFRHGAWPSFWMKSNTPFAKAPYMSEIDVFEVFSSNNAAVCNLHKWTSEMHTMLPEGEGSLNRAYIFENSENLNDEYHTYGFEWNEKFVAFYVDDKEYARFSIDEENDFSPEEMPGMDCFDDFHYILINNEVFTNGKDFRPEWWVLKDEDPLPIDFWVDWIRLYQNPEKEEIVFADDIIAAKKEK